MKLFKFDEYRLKISEEALAIKAFRVIWERDKSRNKGKAIQELGYIYFFCDPRSDYMFLVDEDMRSAKIKEQEGLDKKWVPDKEVTAAMEVYKYLITSEKSQLLDNARLMVSSIQEALKDVSKQMSTVKDVKLKLDLVDRASKTMDRVPDLIKRLNEAEIAVNEDIEEQAQTRGEAVKHLFEDGFDI